MTQKLPKRFTGTGDVKGFEFNQLKESENAYAYEVLDNGIIHYDVFAKRNNPVCIDFDNRVYSYVDFKEKYPATKLFGKEAWCCRDLIKALYKFNDL